MTTSAAIPSSLPSLVVTPNSPSMIYRQFKTLRNRCLLYLQDELVALEHDLGHMDAQDNLSHPKLLFSRFYDEAIKPSRRMELVAKIKGKISEYGKLVMRCWHPGACGKYAYSRVDKMLHSTKDLMQFPQPTERNRRSYATYIENEAPIVPSESSFIRRREDLVTLAGDMQQSWLDGKMDQALSTLAPSFKLVNILFLPLFVLWKLPF